MKKMMFLIVVLAAFSFAHATPPVNEKVLKAFNTAFPAAENAQWHEYGSIVEAYFDNGDVKCRIRFDTNGKILNTIRYYGEKGVAPFLKAKLAQKFPGKTIFGVTEVTSENELAYNFVLEDATSWLHVKSDGIGQMEILEKFKKAN